MSIADRPDEALVEAAQALADGAVNRAAEILGTLRLLHANHPDVLHLSGLADYRLGRLDLAQTRIRSAIQAQPAQAEFWSNLGIVQQAAGDRAAAKSSYARAMTLRPDFITAHINLGKLLLEEGDRAGAIAHFEQGEQQFPGERDQSFQLGRAYQLARRLDDAKAAYARALAADPGHFETYNNLGNVLSDLGERQEAERRYREALALNPGYVDARHNLASLLSDIGQAEAGIALLRELTIEHPELSACWANLADAMLDAGLTEELRALAKDGLARAPQLLGPRLALSELMMSEHDLIDALQFMLAEQSFFKPGAPDDRLRFGLLIKIALAGWMVGRLDLVETPVALMLKQYSPINRAEHNFMVFARYLALLPDHRRQHPVAAPSERSLLVIGDSHSLSAAGQTISFGSLAATVHSRLVMGCKAFHLAQDGDNKYKRSLRHLIAGLPDGLPVIVSIGEIDCRIDDGIIPALRKGHVADLDANIAGITRGYVDFLLACRGDRNLRFGLQGVPYPNFPQLQAAVGEEDTLLSVVQRFNAALAALCRAHGFYFLDVYALEDPAVTGAQTVGAWHIDSHHLRPDYLQAVLARL